MDLVDTDVLIDVQRGHPTAPAWFRGLTNLPAVPGFVVMSRARRRIHAQHRARILTQLVVAGPS
jgi:hypothetical protein